MPEVAYKPFTDVKKVEDIIKKPKIYFPNFLEWVALSGQEQVIITSSAPATILEVPEDKVFFLTTISIVMYANNPAANPSSLNVTETERNTIIHSIAKPLNDGTGEVATISYPMPLRFASGSKFKSTIFNSLGNVKITGFMIDKKILPQLIKE